MLVSNRPREVTMHTLPTAMIQLLAPFVYATLLPQRLGAGAGAGGRRDLGSGQANSQLGLTGCGPRTCRAVPALPPCPQPYRLVGAGGESCAAGSAGEDVRERWSVGH